MGSDETLADGWEGVRLRVLLAAVATRPRRSIYVPTTTAGTGTVHRDRGLDQLRGLFWHVQRECGLAVWIFARCRSPSAAADVHVWTESERRGRMRA